MSKIVKIQVLGADGEPLADQVISLTDHGERNTNAQGLSQYLADDVSNAVLQIGDKEVWSGSTSDLKSSEVFTQSGSGYTRS